MKCYSVDAFTDELFKVNQVGVCLLDEWLSISTILEIL